MQPTPSSNLTFAELKAKDPALYLVRYAGAGEHPPRPMFLPPSEVESAYFYKTRKSFCQEEEITLSILGAS